MFKRKPRRSKQFKRENKVVNIEEARRARRERRQAALDLQESTISEAESTEKQESARRKTQKTRKKYFWLLIAATVLIVFASASFKIIDPYFERKNLEQEQIALQKEKELLERELAGVNDPEYIEQQARSQLHMVKPGEILFIVPNKDKAEETTDGTDPVRQTEDPTTSPEAIE